MSEEYGFRNRGKSVSVIDRLRAQEGMSTRNKLIVDAAEEIEKLHCALENCRLFAARNRKESWALLILGFLAEAGVVGSITRDDRYADHHGPDWTERDGEYLK